MKLNRAIIISNKEFILRTIYFAIFESHLNYCSLIWSQNGNAINRLVILQKKTLGITNLGNLLPDIYIYIYKDIDIYIIFFCELWL